MYDRFYYNTTPLDAIAQAISQSKTEYAWILFSAVDYSNFDLRFVPNKFEKDFCHVWSSHNNINCHTTWLIPVKHYRQDLKPEIKYYDKILPSKFDAGVSYTWQTDDRIDYGDFNFDWLPDLTHWGKDHGFAMQGTQQLSYTFLSYAGATDTLYHKSNLKFKPNAAQDEWHWQTDDRIDYSNFDFSWLPDAWDLNKIHCFPMRGTEKLSYTKLINLKHSSKEEKYHTSDLWFKEPIYKTIQKNLSAANLPEWVWIIDERIDYNNFNFDWLPDAWDIDKHHCFTMQGCEQLHYTKLINTKVAKASNKFHNAALTFMPKAAQDEWHWQTDDRIDYSNFNFDWLPDAWDIDKHHCFTMKGTENLTYTSLINLKQKINKIKYYDAALTFKEDIRKITIDQLNDTTLPEWVWVIDERIDYTNFDFNWLPNSWDLDKKHCFTMQGCKELHYTFLYNTKTKPTKNKFYQTDLKFINPVTKFTQSELAGIDMLPEWYWVIDNRIDYGNFNFDWLPDAWDVDKHHYFTMQGCEQLSYTKLVNSNKAQHNNIKFHQSQLVFTDIPVIHWPIDIDYDNMWTWLMEQKFNNEWVWICDQRIDYSNFNFNWLPDAWDKEKIHCISLKNNQQLSYTWLINTNYLDRKDFMFHRSNLRFSINTGNKIFWPNFITTVLSGFDWYDSLANWILEQELDQEYVWVCDSRINYDDFNFDWLPESWDREFIHCFSMKDKLQLSYTWLVNIKSLKNKKFKYHESKLEFVESNFDTILLDMGHNITSFEFFKKKIRFIGTMEAMLHSAIKRADKEWLYVISSCCNYDTFKFNWLPDLDQISYTHCWPSNDQLKGDTFLIHVPTFLRTNKLDYNFDHDSVQRIPWPPKIYWEDSLAQALNKDRLSSLYVAYYKQDSVIQKFPTPSLWDNRPVVGMSECNSVSLVPRDCVVNEEIYEYPYLERYTKYASPCSLDVIFIHNGEKDAGVNLSRCNITVPSNMNFKISSGVNGRLKAYQAAAELSNNDWFLAIFAKCHMKESFKDFTWRPDYWQKPKHYIFHNHNVDLDLTYGHMAPIAYNKRLMLENTGGLDMTLAQEHAVVPVVLSETKLTDPWDTWRTAFRETVKLMYYAKTDNSIELQYRLDRWLNAQEMWAKHNPWYQTGANDAKNFFESVDGEWNWIMVTNEWDYLREYYSNRHK